MDQKWSHAKVLGKYFEVYGQARPITPEAGEKKAPLLLFIFLNVFCSVLVRFMSFLLKIWKSWTK